MRYELLEWIELGGVVGYPVRAGMAKAPELSDHTSVKSRCEAINSEGCVDGVAAKQPKSLQRFVGNPRQNIPEGLPFRLVD